MLENDDFQEAEAFACIGRKMVCNQRGTRGKEASSVRENRLPLQACGQIAGTAVIPAPLLPTWPCIVYLGGQADRKSVV